MDKKLVEQVEQQQIRDKKVAAISDLISEIRPFLLEAGIPNTNIVFNSARLQKPSLEVLDSAIVWLTAFRQVHCNLIPEAKKLVPDHVWKNYEVLGVRGTEEQNRLNDAKRIVREEWKNRSGILKRKDSGKKSK